MNMEKMKEKKEPLRNSYELDLLTIFFRIGLDFFSDSAVYKDSESIYTGRSQMARQRGL